MPVPTGSISTYLGDSSPSNEMDSIIFANKVKNDEEGTLVIDVVD